MAQLVEEIVATITPLTQGVSFSGGDPLLQGEALKLLKEQPPPLNIWVYTGYTWAEVKRLPALALVDVLQ